MNIDITTINMEMDEVLRYMGVKRGRMQASELDELKEEVREAFKELESVVKPKYQYRNIHIKEMAVVDSSLKLEGESIERFLCGVNEGALMVVTLGHEYEQYVKSRLHMGDSRKSLVIDALGTEMVEKCADRAEWSIREAAGKEKSSRFSPGYGDFSIQFQKPLLDYLEAYRIGLYCNEHCMMFPQKSVSAIVKFEEFKGGCAACEKNDCSYRAQL